MSESLAMRVEELPVPAVVADSATHPIADTATAAYLEMDLLRFSTAGSVDDGKSTLIGRLLYDTKSIFQDQLEAVESASRRRGEAYVNLALLTDGLRAEREQNITIDVAYRYFATPKRKFIIADTPGHIQYTRNMVTGASTAELAIVLVDARKGVLTQSKRHGFLSALLGIPHLVVAVNKMDLVEYRQDVYEEIVAEYSAFAEKLKVGSLVFIPISALHGDNVVSKSENLPWYDGTTLLHHLETVNVGVTRNLVDFRFPVQYVVRAQPDFRGLAGRIVSGTLQPGEEVVALPSGHGSRIRSIETAGGPQPEASAGDSVVLCLEDELDVSRGDMLVRRMNLPTLGQKLEALLCWLSETPLDATVPYLLQHTTRQTKAVIDRLVYRIDVDTLHREEAPTLELNDIGRVQLSTAQPLCFDPYERNHGTGSFILIDPYTHATVAAGMIRGEVKEPPRLHPGQRDVRSSPNVSWEGYNVTREEHEARNGHQAGVLWFTGLSGAGKSSIAREVERRLFAHGCRTVLLDGDLLRHGLSADLGFGAADRKENIRRVGEVARLFYEQGNLVLCTFVSPSREDRDAVRSRFPADRFFEIYVSCDLETLKRRDPKGLYARAERGEIASFTGISAPFEAPQRPELLLDTAREPLPRMVPPVLDLLRRLVPGLG